MQPKGLKKVKTAIYQALERVRDEEAAGSNPVIPTTLNLSNQAVSEVFALSRKVQKNEFDHMLPTFYASNTVVAKVYAVF